MGQCLSGSIEKVYEIKNIFKPDTVYTPVAYDTEASLPAVPIKIHDEDEDFNTIFADSEI